MWLQGNGGGIGSGDSFAPDRTNNVEQVSVSYLPPGEVAIEVRLLTYQETQKGFFSCGSGESWRVAYW